MNRKSVITTILVVLAALILVLLLCLGIRLATKTDPAGEDSSDSGTVIPGGPELNPHASLSIPTCITKIEDKFFIVDCYHDQVIYSDSLDKPLEEWYVMTSDINRGHTVASDGVVYLVDDTENNRVLVFEYENDRFVETAVFEEIGIRPHYIVYNEADNAFYVWSSMTGEMFVFERDRISNDVYLSRTMRLEEVNGIYIRSFTIIDDKILLVSGNRQILEVGIHDLQVTARYPVPDEITGMIQIFPVSGGYYITVSTDADYNQDYATIIFAEDLNDLASGDYTDIYSYFVGGGTPYYLTSIDGKYYLTEHRVKGHRLWSFDIGEDHMPQNVVSIY